MFTFILYTLAVGVLIGSIARIVLGRETMWVGSAIVLGMIGSVIGGLAGYVLTHRGPDDPVFHTSGVVGSVVGAAAALLAYRTATRPSRGRLA